MVGIWFGLLNIAYPGGEEVSQTNYSYSDLVDYFREQWVFHLLNSREEKVVMNLMYTTTCSELGSSSLQLVHFMVDG